MKKIICLFLILIPFIGSAQIMGSSNNARTISVAKHSNTMELFYSTASETYYIKFLSTNQFDDIILLPLGDKEETVYALKFFIKKIDELKKMEYCSINVGGENIVFTRASYFGPCLVFSKRGQAGISYMHKLGLESFLDALD